MAAPVHPATINELPPVPEFIVTPPTPESSSNPSVIPDHPVRPLDQEEITNVHKLPIYAKYRAIGIVVALLVCIHLITLGTLSVHWAIKSILEYPKGYQKGYLFYANKLDIEGLIIPDSQTIKNHMIYRYFYVATFLADVFLCVVASVVSSFIKSIRCATVLSIIWTFLMLLTFAAYVAGAAVFIIFKNKKENIVQYFTLFFVHSLVLFVIIVLMTISIVCLRKMANMGFESFSKSSKKRKEKQKPVTSGTGQDVEKSITFLLPPPHNPADPAVAQQAQTDTSHLSPPPPDDDGLPAYEQDYSMEYYHEPQSAYGYKQMNPWVQPNPPRYDYPGTVGPQPGYSTNQYARRSRGMISVGTSAMTATPMTTTTTSGTSVYTAQSTRPKKSKKLKEKKSKRSKKSKKKKKKKSKKRR